MTISRLRSVKELIGLNLALLPERRLFEPILEQADRNGLLPDATTARLVLQQLGLDDAEYLAWAQRQLQLPASDEHHDEVLRDVAEIHEFWVSRQEVA